MRRFALLASLLGSSLFLTAQAPVQQAQPYGLWLTENHRSVIELYKCGKDGTILCGRIAWIIKDGMQFGTKNPKADMRGKPLCGMTLISGLKPTNPPVEWDDGVVYKADEGALYDADLDMLSANTIKVRGYMGLSLLGKSQTWERVSAKDYPRCKAPKAAK